MFWIASLNSNIVHRVWRPSAKCLLDKSWSKSLNLNLDSRLWPFLDNLCWRNAKRQRIACVRGKDRVSLVHLREVTNSVVCQRPANFCVSNNCWKMEIIRFITTSNIINHLIYFIYMVQLGCDSVNTFHSLSIIQKTHIWPPSYDYRYEVRQVAATSFLQVIVHCC